MITKIVNMHRTLGWLFIAGFFGYAYGLVVVPFFLLMAALGWYLCQPRRKSKGTKLPKIIRPITFVIGSGVSAEQAAQGFRTLGDLMTGQPSAKPAPWLQPKCRDDRDYKVGDHLILNEYDPQDGYTRSKLGPLEISFLMLAEDFPGIAPGFVLLGLKSPKEDLAELLDDIVNVDHYCNDPLSVLIDFSERAENVVLV